MLPATPTQNGPPPAPDSPMTARLRRAQAAQPDELPAASSPRFGSQALEDDEDDSVDRPSSPSTGDKHGRSEDDAGTSRFVRPRLLDARPSNNGWRDLSYLVAPAVKDQGLSTSALARVQRYAKAPSDERAFMAYINSEVVLSKFKAAADDWEISQSLKTLLKARIAACMLSPHIPEYKRCLMKHITPLIPPASRHLLPDESNSAHKQLLKTFVLESATSARNVVKTAIMKSMLSFNMETGQDVLDVTQGWCMGKLCEEIVNKLGTDADIQVTAEVQGRVALLRFIVASYTAESLTPTYWDRVDDTLMKQRKLEAPVLARDIADGLKDDLKTYTGESWDSFTLVDAKTVAPESLQACADKAMRDYYKTVKPLVKKPVRAGGGR